MEIQFRNEHHRLIANLHKTDGYIVNHFQQKMAPFDLSVQQDKALRLLSDAFPNSLTAGELKEKMTDMNSDMTRLIDRLVAKNLVIREGDPTNTTARRYRFDFFRKLFEKRTSEKSENFPPSFGR